ncbi:MAG: N-acetylmuramoyl-L-alanine amidase [Legionellaceae bacterium]|nr:N-acetylmuramoyl-L-alanine amidase [Legionellaceae bacterium]
MRAQIVVLLKLFLLLGFFLTNQNALAAKLDSIKIVNGTRVKTILFKISGNYKHKVYPLRAPDRLVFDFNNTDLSFDPEKIVVENNLIRKLRVGHPNKNTLRLVLDLKQAVLFKEVKLKTPNPHETILKVEINTNPKHAIKKTSVVAVSSAPKKTLRDVVVIIDPGHGGKDPGAIGIRNSREKHIVLAIAKKLKKLIDDQRGMRAVLTRSGDYYVGLRERMDIARKYDGDLFVAIHADAFGNHDSHGASVFALSQTGATSEAARWIAEKENYSELGGVDLSSLDDQNGVIRTVLIDLSQTATINASLNMGKSVLDNLDKMTSLHSKRVEQARFVVLKSPDIPSVLIETGFISNPREERNLTNAHYQSRLTKAIFAGIKTYFWNFPPYGSRIEAMSMANRKIVRNNILPLISRQV